jgi:hypothetical protein
MCKKDNKSRTRSEKTTQVSELVPSEWEQGRALSPQHKYLGRNVKSEKMGLIRITIPQIYFGEDEKPFFTD